MSPRMKFYLAQRKVLSRKETLKLLAKLTEKDFHPDTYKVSRSTIIVGTFSAATLFMFSVVGGVISLQSHNGFWIVLSTVGITLSSIGYGLGYLYVKNKQEEAVAQAYQNAHHVENVLKMSEVISDLIPNEVKEVIDLNFYHIEEFQNYYSLLRRYVMSDFEKLLSLIEAEEELLIKQDQQRQQQEDVALMGKKEPGHRFLKVPPQHRQKLDQKKRAESEGIYAEADSSLHQRKQSSGT